MKLKQKVRQVIEKINSLPHKTHLTMDVVNMLESIIQPKPKFDEKIFKLIKHLLHTIEQNRGVQTGDTLYAVKCLVEKIAQGNPIKYPKIQLNELNKLNKINELVKSYLNKYQNMTIQLESSEQLDCVTEAFSTLNTITKIIDSL